MRVAAQPTLHEWLLYAASHPAAWLLAEVARHIGAVVRVPMLGTIVNDPALAASILHRDDSFTKAGRGTVGALVTQVLGPTALINMDGPDHRALRDRLRDLFSPRYIDDLSADSMAPRLVQLRQDLTDGRTVDLVSFMHQLTGSVTCGMLGLRVADADAETVYATIAALGQHLAAAVRFTARPLSQRRVTELRAQVDELIAPAYEAYVSGNFRPHSIAARLHELGLGFAEAKGIIATLFLVGTQTTSVALPRLVALLVDTGQWQLLRQQPDLLTAALDEGLRCTVPVPGTIRSVAHDVSIDDYQFNRGSRVFILTHNMAKTPHVFDRPEQCDITRDWDPHIRHFWYGGGPHFCLGFALAQHEMRAMLGTLLSVPGELRVVRRRYARNVMLPAYSRLDVQVVHQ